MLNDWLITFNLNPNWERVEYTVLPWADKVTYEHKRSKERRTYFVRNNRHD